MKCLICERVLKKGIPYAALRRGDTEIIICEPCILTCDVDLRDINIVATFYELIADPSIAGENGGRVNAAVQMLVARNTIGESRVYQILRKFRPKFERTMAAV